MTAKRYFGLVLGLAVAAVAPARADLTTAQARPHAVFNPLVDNDALSHPMQLGGRRTLNLVSPGNSAIPGLQASVAGNLFAGQHPSPPLAASNLNAGQPARGASFLQRIATTHRIGAIVHEIDPEALAASDNGRSAPGTDYWQRVSDRVIEASTNYWSDTADQNPETASDIDDIEQGTRDSGGAHEQASSRAQDAYWLPAPPDRGWSTEPFARPVWAAALTFVIASIGLVLFGVTLRLRDR